MIIFWALHVTVHILALSVDGDIVFSPVISYTLCILQGDVYVCHGIKEEANTSSPSNIFQLR